MPIFEYVCQKCQHQFETLVYGATVPQCPACQSKKLERQLSVFAANTKGAAATRREMPVGPCGSCGDPRGPGSCATN